MAVGPRGHQLISKEGPAVREAENQFQKEIDLTDILTGILHRKICFHISWFRNVY